MKHRSVRGTIRYTSVKPGMAGMERGREYFSFTHHRDGSTILRAQCEIEEPAPTVLRDVIYHIGPDMTPLHLHVQLMLDDEFLGSGWMRHDVAAKMIECESAAPTTGRRSESRTVGDFDGFGTHPVVADAYATRLMADAAAGSRRQLRMVLPSADHRGATPPAIAEVLIDLEYVGVSRREVAAGAFDCRHFRFIDDSSEGMGGRTHPAYDIWVTDDDDAILVYGAIDGYMMNRYELVELVR